MAAKKREKGPLTTGLIADNRRARYDYTIEDTLEAGLVLTGTEVKSLRLGGVHLSDAYAGPSSGEMYLYNLHIAEYQNAPRQFQHAPKRIRKILLKKKEMNKMLGTLKRGGMTLIPLKLYFNERGRCKLLLGLAKGKNVVDKRQTIKDRDWQRNKAKILKDG